MNKDQKLFNKSELLKLGFRKKGDGGYHYYTYDNQPKNPDNDPLITNDMITGLSNPIFHVNSLKAGEDVKLTREQIESYINKPDENGQTKVYNPSLFGI